jgi:hypothetical protein
MAVDFVLVINGGEWNRSGCIFQTISTTKVKKGDEL